jgi:uncharacterized protein YdaU (DUF1376 family)
MHYFKFNIATWIQSTRHLSPQDEGIYLRLINHYYDTEGSFPVDLKPVLKRLQLLQYAESVDEILADFFVLTDKGWQHNKCNELLKEFKKSAKKNKVNGAKGGRPAKAKALSVTEKEPNGLPVGTQPEPKHNPNYELRTKNQELETINHKPLLKMLDQSEIDCCFDQFWKSGIRKVNKKNCKPKFVKYLRNNQDPEGPTIYDLTTALCNDISARILNNQLGFSEMHPTTYLNGDRWLDELKENNYETAKNNHARPESNLARFSRKIQADIAAEDPFE